MPSARCSMLERAPQDDRTTEARPVAFRGAGFVPTAGRASGWIALALVIALWQLAGSAGWVNPLFLPAPSAIAVAIYKLAMSVARSGSTFRLRSFESAAAGCSAPSPA